MQLHPRFQHVQKASYAVKMILTKFQQDNDLTDIEMLQAVLGWGQDSLRFMLRAERHPDDSNKKADEL